MKKELNVGSLTTAPTDKIPFFSLVEARNLNGGIREIHAILDNNNRNPEIVAEIGRRAFGIEIKPKQVQITHYIPDESDTSFAKEFGFTILPIACVTFKKGKVEAWIGPALVPVEHPLYHKTEKSNSVHVVSEKAEDQSGKGFFYYIRLRVKDRAGVLAQICWKLANKEISLRQMSQPEAGKGIEEVNMAFLLWPCQAKALQSALKAMADLSDVVHVNIPLRAFSKSK